MMRWMTTLYVAYSVGDDAVVVADDSFVDEYPFFYFHLLLSHTSFMK